VSIPPATSTSLNNHPASPSDSFVPNFSMSRYSPLFTNTPMSSWIFVYYSLPV